MPDQPLTDEHLARLLVHGPRPVHVELVEYDPAWVDRYRRRADELREVLGERLRSVDHVGSTSVPGLAAKDIVDIAIGLADPDDEADYLPDLQALGYDLRVREPGHRCLRGGEPDQRINLHCYRAEDPELRRYRVFRDRLRSHPADLERYQAVKRSLAGREWPDMNYYAEAKTPVIRDVLRRAGWVEPV